MGRHGVQFAARAIAPRRDHQQLVLSLREEEQKSIFLAYCNDLVRNLEGVDNTKERIAKLEESIVRWGRFFEKCGREGLSIFQQAGLFAELTWLELLLSSKLSPGDAVDAWKGCERNFHDFDIGGDVVEVKSSMTKEPQQITINNERQLDERGLNSLHLFFVALRTAKGGGQSLPQKVDSVRKSLAPPSSAAIRFEDCLISAGYLINTQRFTDCILLLRSNCSLMFVTRFHELSIHRTGSDASNMES